MQQKYFIELNFPYPLNVICFLHQVFLLASKNNDDKDVNDNIDKDDDGIDENYNDDDDDTITNNRR